MEERTLLGHFSEYASDGPDVDGGRVTLTAEENLWRSVPQRDNLMRVHTDGDSERSGESEICQFDDTIGVNEQILRFQISMQDSCLVTKKNCLQDLVCVALHLEEKGFKQCTK
jgi:hypothetical protein